MICLRFRIILDVLGAILWLLAGFMLVPLLVALYYGEPLITFLAPLCIMVFFATILTFFNKHQSEEWSQKEVFLIVALTWIVAAYFYSLPFMLEGIAPVTALFESMAGVTATGATALTDIENYSKGLLFWRNMTQWLGGMGIIMLFIAILPKLGIAGRQMFRAEVPVLQEEKLRPRISGTAKNLWLIYVMLSIFEFIVLKIAGMSNFDAITHTFSCISTAGFSPYSESIAVFDDPIIESILVIFMVLGGMNFALHYKMIFTDRKCLMKDQEFKFYMALIIAASLILGFMLFKTEMYSLSTAFRYSIFHVVSIITTTGYAITDYNLWPDSCRFLLFLLMFIGGCAGSTSGGVKVVRLLLLLKHSHRVLFKTLHPKAVVPIRLNGKVVPEDIIHSIVSFMVIYVMIFFVSSTLLTFTGLDFIASMSASIATLGNLGPGFGIVGPMGSFASISDPGKLMLMINMWIGRLEVFTVMVLLLPDFWKR